MAKTYPTSSASWVMRVASEAEPGQHVWFALEGVARSRCVDKVRAQRRRLFLMARQWARGVRPWTRSGMQGYSVGLRHRYA